MLFVSYLVRTTKGDLHASNQTLNHPAPKNDQDIKALEAIINQSIVNSTYVSIVSWQVLQS